MKVFKAPKFENEKITKFLSRKIRKKGFINRKNCETLEVHFNLLRPFRYVFWNCKEVSSNNERKCISLLDEDFALIVTDLDEQLLLWRPRYSDLTTEDIPLNKNIDTIEKKNDFHVRSVIDNLVKRQKKAIDVLADLDSDLHKMHRESMSVSTLLLPKSPSYTRKESQLVDEKKLSHSVLVATSLVTNCSIEDTIISAKLGERAFVNTIAAEYINNSTRDSRWLFLETPGTKSLNDALKNGRALTRLCSLNIRYRNKFSELIL